MNNSVYDYAKKYKLNTNEFIKKLSDIGIKNKTEKN